MAEEDLPDLSEEINTRSAYPMFFGVSCAFLALQVLTSVDAPSAELGHRSSCLTEMMLRGSAQLLGLLFEKAQKRHEDLQEKRWAAQFEVVELKRIRAEDAKANEKVMSIFATREQSWQAQRRRLLNRIQFISRELSLVKSERDLEEQARRLKDNFFEEEEAKLCAAQKTADELRERAEKERQDHMLELRRHKTAFTEVVSHQRRLEAEMARLLRHADAAKEELAEVFWHKEEAMAMVENLSAEFVKLQKDTEHKGNIISAMLQKAKHDTAEKQTLLKELKLTKAKKKQAEMEAEGWKSMFEAKRMNSSGVPSGEPVMSGKRVDLQSGCRVDLRARLLECLASESNKGHEFPSMEKTGSVIKPLELQGLCLNESDGNNLVLEQKHYSEVEAFAEQLRIRDEKLEAFHWRLLSTELDSKTLQSQIQGLDGSLAQLREKNMKLEALLIDRERELKSLKDRSSFYENNFPVSISPPVSEVSFPQSFDSLMKATKGKPIIGGQNLYEVETNIQERIEIKNVEEIVLLRQFKSGRGAENIIGYLPFLSTNLFENQQNDGNSSQQSISAQITSQTLKEEIEEKEVGFYPNLVHERSNSMEDSFASASSKLASDGQPFLKMNVHALGVSFNIKRLRQQLALFENLAGTLSSNYVTSKDDAADNNNNEKAGLKGLMQVIYLLNKQVKRYQSLEEKINALGRKMLQNSGAGTGRLPLHSGNIEETDKLEHFLEETFQLQRCMVATGQKLMELQSKIKSSLGGVEGERESPTFNLGRFLHVVRTLFEEVQRGLEVRIARIICGIEGTLASDSILRR